MCIRDRVQRAHGCHHMEMRVRDAAVLFLRSVKSKVGNHAFCHKLLLHELPRQFHCLLYTSEIRETLEGTQKGGVKNSIRNCLTVFQRDPLFRGADVYKRQLLIQRIL